MSLFLKFRNYVDNNRNSLIYKILSPIKFYLRKKFNMRNAYFIIDLNAVYYHSLKCGGTSIKKTFKNKGYTLVSHRQNEIYDKGYFNFTFSRNPYSRVVSMYEFLKDNKGFCRKFSIKDNSTFEEFVNRICEIKDRDANEHTISLTALHSINGKVDYFDFVGKLENFNKDFKKLCDILDVENIELLHKNKTIHKNWKEYYTEELKEKVYQRYKDDFDNFGYEK